MINNDILRRVRYIFDFSDKKMVELFALADLKVEQIEIHGWLKKEDEEGFQACNDTKMATYLNGLIIDKRGRREGEQPKPEKKLTNNIILTKLKIALDLKAEAVLDIMELAGLKISKHELSAFSRRQGHKHYRECQDQILRNFLKGLQIKFRPSGDSEPEPEPEIEPDSVWNQKKKPVEKS